MRINARLDEDSARKLEFLLRRTDATVTEVVKEAIDRYYQSIHAEPEPFKVFAEAGFIGCMDGPPDLSTNYKDLLTEGLLDKHGDR